MKSLIRSDFYKLRKAKSFWVCMILAVALAVFSVLIMDFSVKLMDKVPQQAAQEEAALEESGLNISTDGIPMSSADLNASNMLLMCHCLSVENFHTERSKILLPKIIPAPRFIFPR